MDTGNYMANQMSDLIDASEHNHGKRYDRKRLLLTRCKLNVSFTHEGRTYEGFPSKAVDAFVAANPDGLADFSVWLQNNWKEVRNEL